MLTSASGSTKSLSTAEAFAAPVTSGVVFMWRNRPLATGVVVLLVAVFLVIRKSSAVRNCQVAGIVVAAGSVLFAPVYVLRCQDFCRDAEGLNTADLGLRVHWGA